MSNIQPGAVMLAKPKHFHPLTGGTVSVSSFFVATCNANVRRCQRTIGHHPVVVLSTPNENGLVMIASMSHQHPGNPPQRPTSTYNLPMDPIKGEGTINVGWPSLIHFTRLKQTSAPLTMSRTDLAVLMGDIRESLYL